MFWEILISNLISTFIVGGGILTYHLYIKYKEQQYYNYLKQQLGDMLMGVSYSVLYYMVLKGSIDVNQIKNILNMQPHLKQHFPFDLDDIQVTPISPISPMHQMNCPGPIFDSHEKLYYAPAPMSHFMNKCKAKPYPMPKKFHCSPIIAPMQPDEHDIENDSFESTDVAIKKVSI